ncbi:flagellar hook-associated protein 3 FlgL [Actimicrobium sp. GrIS 1.19]|uniref:flagellar hook-associated protein FlgL n=1 Tax=Actimicrobium sp. GrIS 1.19 TaxID=3071708 RepID=UPI002E041CD1|nr:flagellar hook-associated protein 3 FlgL [Actimicrobium sp. GrIS 1.19]
MRISTTSFFENASSKISDLQATLAHKQAQISANTRILTPADDPVAAAAAVEVTQADGVNTQYAANRESAKTALTLQETTLSSYTDLLQNIKTLTVAAGNGALDDTQRSYLATELSNNYDQLLGIANTRDSAGNFIFGGYKTTSQPFTATAGGVTYNGDQGQRLLQVSTSRQLPINDSGTDIFSNIKTGNGTFTTAGVAGNTGNAVINPGTVTNVAALTNHNYSIDFTSATAFKVYDVTLDPGKAAPLAASGTYVPGQAIAFDGLQFDISGTPGSADRFTVAPSTNQSIFTSISNLITTLKTPAIGTAGKAALLTGLNAANTNFSAALDVTLTVRASGGSRLQELDALDNEGSARTIQYAARLSTLQDLDLVKAYTELTQQQATLTAAQQSFVKIANLSLFNYIN